MSKEFSPLGLKHGEKSLTRTCLFLSQSIINGSAMSHLHLGIPCSEEAESPFVGSGPPPMQGLALLPVLAAWGSFGCGVSRERGPRLCLQRVQPPPAGTPWSREGWQGSTRQPREQRAMCQKYFSCTQSIPNTQMRASLQHSSPAALPLLLPTANSPRHFSCP